MTGIEALNAICAECQRDKGKIQVACPWRAISGDYCAEYETIKSCIEENERLKKQLDAKCDRCIERDRKETAQQIYDKIFETFDGAQNINMRFAYAGIIVWIENVYGVKVKK